MSGLLKREATSIGAWLIFVFQWILFGLGLAVGYWLSDLLYGAGLWPIGALLRIGLFIGALGWLAQAVMLVVGFFVLIFSATRA